MTAFSLTFARPAAAQATCPAQFLPFPAIERQDERKDKNDNGIVCGKLGPDGKFHGGPDDVFDDTVHI